MKIVITNFSNNKKNNQKALEDHQKNTTELIGEAFKSRIKQEVGTEQRVPVPEIGEEKWHRH